MNKHLFQLSLGLLAILFLLYSRINVISLGFFIPIFFIMVFYTFREQRIFGLVTLATVGSLVLSLRFKYLTWGDSWNEYAMILRILEYKSLAMDVYPSQQPAMHLIVANLAMITQINPMSLLKFTIPIFSIFSIIFLYKFVNDFFGDKDLGLLASLLLLIGTPYLHWTTQAVRESLGIPMFIIGFYFAYKSLKSPKLQNIIVSIILISGLILTHNFSSAIFIISWLSFSVIYVYIYGKTRNLVSSLAILLFTTIIAAGWWSLTKAPISYIVKSLEIILPGSPLIILTISITIIYAVPYFFPIFNDVFKKTFNGFLSFKIIKVLIIIITIGLAIAATELVRGKLFLILHYPIPMLFNGFFMIILSLVGLYFSLNLRGLPILFWIAAITLPFILSIFRIIPFGDPLRFMDHIYIPLAIVSAVGLKQIFMKIPQRGLQSGIIAMFATISLVTAFPSVVFWGSMFEKGNMLFDDRSYIIQHDTSEKKAIDWIGTYYVFEGNPKPVIFSDNYVIYASKSINLRDELILDNRQLPEPKNFFKEDHSLGRIYDNKNTYFLITERMHKYAEFAEGMRHERYFVSKETIEKFNEDSNLIYDDGSAKIYYIHK